MSNNFVKSTKSLAGVPVYQDIKLYGNILLDMRIWEAEGWKQESMSWKIGCYVHAGLNGPMEITFRGPEAQKFLSSVSINNCFRWQIGMSKHLVMCDENGLIATHGLTLRDSEDSFRHFASLPWPVYMIGSAGMDVEVSLREIFILQIAGPTSLQVLEQVTDEALRDINFLAARRTQVAGIDAEIEVSRIGMVGNLAYELRGPLEYGPVVYDAVYQAGRDLGIKRLGWRTYVVNHVEGGFPQLNCTFTGSCLADPGFMSTDFGARLVANMSGSVDPANTRARFRTPVEVGWGWMAKFDHEFIGCQEVEAEVANPKRTIVTLRWNPEDVIDIYASLFRPGEEYKTLELPCAQQQPAGGHADLVTKDGRQIGISSATTYSYYYREVISHCTIDVDQSQIGNEVVVHWGDFGKRIKEVRATVERFPYLDLPRNQNYDLSTVPSEFTGR